MHKTTRLIHHDYKPPEGFVSPQEPTHKASTVIFPNVAAMRARDWKNKSGYTYGLHGTPTTFTLEERIATLEGALHCQLVPSGLAAIALVNLALLERGDEVLIPSNAYGPNAAFAKNELSKFGVSYQIYDPMFTEDLEQKINSKTALVWIEAPGSVTMEFPDLIGTVSLCRRKKVTTALDNTWGGGLAFHAFDLLANNNLPSKDAQPALGVDISIQALTKYASGGGDVLMGSVCWRDAALVPKLKLTHMRLGLGVGADDAQCILRSLPSMELRYKAQDQTARFLAQKLSNQAQVAQVLHPAFASSAGHAHWASCSASTGLAASIFSFIIKPNYTQSEVDLFCDSLQYFKIGYSWGGQMSLVVPYDLREIRPEPSPHSALLPGHLVRLCIGLEEREDLWGDLQAAMLKALPI
jgi:cystathionine beta-lyase